MHKTPVVSIIVPIFNRIEYLDTAIKSILNQTFKDYEVIIINDGSTNDIQKDLEKFVQNAPDKIKLLYQPNRGPAGARNYGIREAMGQYIAFLDADDEWKNDFLITGITTLKNNNCQWVDTAAYRTVLNEKEEPIETSIIFLNSTHQTNNLFEHLLCDDVIGMPSKVIIEKTCLEKVGGFREDLRIREDWEMWLRLAKAKFEYSHIPEPLYEYKIRKNSLTKTENLKGLECTYKVLSDYSNDAFKINPKNRELYAEKMWDIARHILKTQKKDFVLFAKCILKSQIYKPSLKRLLSSLNTRLKKRI